MDTDLSGLTVVSNCKRHQVKVLRHLFFWLEAYLSAVVSQMDHPLSAWKQESTAMSRLWTALHRLFQKKTSAGNSNSKAQKVHVLYSEAANCRRKSFQTRIFSMWFQEQCPKSGRDHVLSHNSIQLKRFFHWGAYNKMCRLSCLGNCFPWASLAPSVVGVKTQETAPDEVKQLGVISCQFNQKTNLLQMSTFYLITSREEDWQSSELEHLWNRTCLLEWKPAETIFGLFCSSCKKNSTNTVTDAGFVMLAFVSFELAFREPKENEVLMNASIRISHSATEIGHSWSICRLLFVVNSNICSKDKSIHFQVSTVNLIECGIL